METYPYWPGHFNGLLSHFDSDDALAGHTAGLDIDYRRHWNAGFL